jgi:hypothetical protein
LKFPSKDLNLAEIKLRNVEKQSAWYQLWPLTSSGFWDYHSPDLFFLSYPFWPLLQASLFWKLMEKMVLKPTTTTAKAFNPKQVGVGYRWNPTKAFGVETH